jgi:tRNA dimethylallyltransferase
VNINMVTGTSLKPLLVIVGETASGKSDLAIRLAEYFNGELICADSWTVRRKMDIGSAKPSLCEQSKVVHHLLDIVEPDQEFSAAVFKRIAEEKIDQISNRGKLPILVGGTGLYVDSLLFNYSFLPEGDKKKRRELDSLSIPQIIDKLHSLKVNLDNIDVRNKRRLIRLIETNGALPKKDPMRSDTLMIGIRLDREELNQRINDRVGKMIRADLKAEVESLVATYGWRAEGLKGVGYAQWKEYFNGQDTIEEVNHKIVKATQDLAKRQRTWFKRNKSIHWLSTPTNFDELVDLVTTSLYK